MTNVETDGYTRLFSFVLKEIISLHNISGESFSQILLCHHTTWAVPQHIISIWLKLLQMTEESYLSFIRDRSPETLYCFKYFDFWHNLKDEGGMRRLNIKCKIDRLELYHATKQIHVMRYQTNSLPTQKQNKNGESFLLIACALVLLQNPQILWHWQEDYSWHIHYIRINKGRLEGNCEVFTKLDVCEMRKKLIQMINDFATHQGNIVGCFKVGDVFYDRQYRHIARKK
ncbi:hypothetical protein [Candidatus Sarmatiella mevalonica]|uniref:hypothetical protein n=1 Tax=Candidatus Sarmatiella mevalonica TaxID=2770581 RepID=UPI001924947A|nr:hypothetical protein [Candidatus Sarmatiella mevalonica]